MTRSVYNGAMVLRKVSLSDACYNPAVSSTRGLVNWSKRGEKMQQYRCTVVSMYIGLNKFRLHSLLSAEPDMNPRTNGA